MTNAEENRNWDKDIPSESRTKRLRLYRNIMIYAVLAPGSFLAFFTLVPSLSSYYLPTFISEIYGALGIIVVTSIIFVPLFWLVNSEYRKCDLLSPSELKYKECRGTRKNQCKICKRHPVSKKYHIKNFHNKKNERIKDCFVACGCMKCEKWEYYGE